MAAHAAVALLVLLSAAAPPLHAETYKWVDEKGVVNYSNAPPPSARAAKSVQTVQDRITPYETDPWIRRAMQNYSRTGYADAQAPQGPHVAVIGAAYTACPSPYRTDCLSSYRSSSYYPYAAVTVFRSTRQPAFSSASFHHRPHTRSSASRSSR